MRPYKWILVLLLLIVIAQYVSTRRGGYRPRPRPPRPRPRPRPRPNTNPRYSGGRYSSRGRGTRYSPRWRPSGRFSTYTPARGSRFYGGFRPNYGSYGYSSWRTAATIGFIYGFYHYRMMYYRRHGNYGCSTCNTCCDNLPEPAICRNTQEYTNQTNKFGQFICPLKNNTDAEKYCCGDDSAQYCCTLNEVRYEEQMRNEKDDTTGLYIALSLLGLLALAVVCVCVCRCYYTDNCCCERQPRRHPTHHGGGGGYYEEPVYVVQQQQQPAQMLQQSMYQQQPMVYQQQPVVYQQQQPVMVYQ